MSDATEWLSKPQRLVAGMALFTVGILGAGLLFLTFLDGQISKGVTPVSKELSEYKAAQLLVQAKTEVSITSAKIDNTTQYSAIIQKLESLSATTNSMQTDIAVIKARAK